MTEKPPYDKATRAKGKCGVAVVFDGSPCQNPSQNGGPCSLHAQRLIAKSVNVGIALRDARQYAGDMKVNPFVSILENRGKIQASIEACDREIRQLQERDGLTTEQLLEQHGRLVRHRLTLLDKAHKYDETVIRLDLVSRSIAAGQSEAQELVSIVTEALAALGLTRVEVRRAVAREIVNVLRSRQAQKQGGGYVQPKAIEATGT